MRFYLMELFWNGGNDNYNTKPTPDEKPSILIHSLTHRVCHGFRLTKQDDYFWVNFDHF